MKPLEAFALVDEQVMITRQSWAARIHNEGPGKIMVYPQPGYEEFVIEPGDITTVMLDAPDDYLPGMSESRVKLMAFAEEPCKLRVELEDVSRRWHRWKRFFRFEGTGIVREEVAKQVAKEVKLEPKRQMKSGLRKFNIEGS